MEEGMMGSLACQEPAYSEEYTEYIYRYYSGVTMPEEDCYALVNNNKQIIVYRQEPEYNVSRYGLAAIPRYYGLLDDAVVDETGVAQIRRLPSMDLLGQGTLIGFVDTGIDYTHEVFRNADGTTRIWSIWDQSIPYTEESILGRLPTDFFYGTEYTRTDINLALETDDPFSLVPTRDLEGHGTYMAGIAAGNEVPEEGFSGMAPLADIIMVKCKEAKQNLKSFYKIDSDAPCYQESDIMQAIKYLIRKASVLSRPLVICLGMGTNLGDHNGGGHLGEQLGAASNEGGIVITAAGGNEAGLAHHHRSNMIMPNREEDVEIRVGEREKGFTTSLWCNAPQLFSVGIISPSGEFSGKILARIGESREINFLLERTTVYVDFQLVDIASGDEMILLRFENPVEGIWRIRLYNDGTISGVVQMWLPIRNFIVSDTFFLVADPEITICEPGNNPYVITNATYDYRNNSLYTNSSRGYARNGLVKPDITAPGVDVLVPLPGNRYGERTGSSVGSAVTAGISALMLQWGILEENDPTMNGTVVLKYLIRGAVRMNIVYPNPSWGYGIINIYDVFLNLRPSI